MSSTALVEPTTKPFRVAIASSLSTRLGIPFVQGPRNAGQETGDLGCVWLDGKIPMPGDGNMEQLTYGVRLLPFWLQSQGEQADDRNVDRLEALLETLQGTLRELLLSAGHDFFNVGPSTIDYENQWVEVALIAFQRNLGAAGG